MKFISKSLSETKKIAKMFANNVFGFSKIFISGKMGSGKTHFIQYLLKELGVEEKIKSPTYTLSNYYKCEFGKIWHYDIYRIKEDGYLSDLEEHLNSKDFVIVEWGEGLKIKPKNRIEVEIKSGKEINSKREFIFKFYGTHLKNNEIKKLFDKFRTPKHVMAHIKMVTKIADRICANLINKGILVDEKLVHTGALLHDIVRYIDFHGGVNRGHFKYKISDDDFSLWKKLEKKYEGVHHADVAGDLLEQMGYPEIGRVIRSHKARYVFNGLKTIEEKVVYFADKCVLHDKEVSIEERLKDGRKRYHRDGSEDHWKKLYKELKKLKKELLINNNVKIENNQESGPFDLSGAISHLDNLIK